MSPTPKKIIVTIDTEAQVLRASCEHVAKLIYGDFGTAENYGIMEMMHLANKYDAKLVFFLDIAMTETFGKQVMRKIVRDIYDNGHDVQIHFHVDQLSREWTGKNLRTRRQLDTSPYSDVFKVFTYIEEVSKDIGLKDILAFRAGGWRFNEHVVAVMSHFGYKMSFHYNPELPERAAGNQDATHRPIFRHPNGLLELPLSTRGAGTNKRRRYNILDGTNSFTECDDEVIVAVLHSWSLLSLKDNSPHFEPCGRRHYDNFEKFLKFVQDNSDRYKIVDTASVYSAIKDNEYGVADIFPRRMYIRFDYQNLEKAEDFKTIQRDVPPKFQVNSIGSPVYSGDSKRITVELREEGRALADFTLVDNKANAARISNVRLLEHKRSWCV